MGLGAVLSVLFYGGSLDGGCECWQCCLCWVRSSTHAAPQAGKGSQYIVSLEFQGQLSAYVMHVSVHRFL
jgi:hypothetical protein